MSNPSRTSSMDTMSSDSSPSVKTEENEPELSFEDMLRELQEKPVPKSQQQNSSPKPDSPKPAADKKFEDEELSFEDILKELAEKKEREREAKRLQEQKQKTLTKSRSTFNIPVKLPSLHLLRGKSSSNIRLPPAQPAPKPTANVEAATKDANAQVSVTNKATPPASPPTTLLPKALSNKSKSESSLPQNALSLLQVQRPLSVQTNPTEIVEKGQSNSTLNDDAEDGDDDDGVSFEDFLKELAAKKETTAKSKPSTPKQESVPDNLKSNVIPTLSLRDVLTSEKYRKFFRTHIEKERSIENIMFYEDVEKYKALKLKLRQKKAKEIIEKYLLPDSLQGININRVLANNILRRIEYEGAVVDLFDPIVLELEATVLSDSFWRFQPSKLFLEMIKAK